MIERPLVADPLQLPSLFRLMTERIPGVVWATDTELQFTASFGAGLQALALQPSQVIGKTLFEYFQTEDDAFPPIAAHVRALQGEVVDYEQIWQNRVFQCHLAPLIDSDGEVIGCVGFAQDTTEQKQAETALRASEAKCRRLHESMMDGFDVMDLEGRIEEFNDACRQMLDQHKRSQDALRQSHEELRAIYDCMVDGLLIADVETKAFARANRAICQMLGYSPEELGAMSVLDIHPKEDLSAVLAAFQSQAEGKMLRAENLPVRRKDGSVFWADISSNRILYQGRPCLIGFFRDVTERRRGEEQLKVNLRSQHAISSLLRRTLESISLEEQFENALESLTSIPWLAVQAKGAIFVLDETTNELTLKSQLGIPPELAASCARVPFGHCLCGRAASTREILFADCVDDRHETRYPGMLEHGHYCVPFVSHGQLLGVLTLYLEQGHRLDRDEMAFLATVGDVLAGLLDRNQLEQSLRKRDVELIGAKTIQETLLPGSPPNAPGFDIAGHCYPAEVAAGDHFDYLWLPDGSLLLVLADVSGHGLGPALVAADFSARLRTLSEDIEDLSEIAVRANAGLYKETTGEVFVTAILGRLDTNARSMKCLNAGHPDAIVLNSAGEIKARFSSGGLPFAILPEVYYPADPAVPLADGDLAFFYTDGLVEAHSTGQALFGFDRALEIVRANQRRPASEIVETLYRSACQYTGSDRPQDDITVLIVKAFAAEAC